MINCPPEVSCIMEWMTVEKWSNFTLLLISPFFDSECYYAILVETSFYTLQEFILSNSERKKQSSSLQDGSSKKALDNFRQVILKLSD